MFVRISLMLALVCCAGQVLTAQSSGEVTGIVTDASGAVVAGANLRLTQAGTGVTLSAASNESGLYRFGNLTPGTYTLEAQHAGFSTSRVTGIAVEVNRVARADLALQVSTAQQELVVTAGSQTLDFDTSANGHILNSRQIESLPLQTKNPLGLITLTPGVIGLSGGAATNRQGGDAAAITAAIVVNGGVRTNAGGFNEFLVDGISTTNRIDGTILGLPGADSLQEFQVQSAALPAEFGQTVGGVISYITKSGSNALHGLLFENYRGTATNARRAIPATSPKPPNNYNQFGGTIGGPVYLPKIYDGRNRTFFYFGYDGSRWVRNNPATANVPTAKMHNGDFSEVTTPIYDPSTGSTPASLTAFPNNQIPQSRWNTYGKKILDAFPLPNSPGTANNYQGVFRVYTPDDVYAAKIDQVLTDKQRFFLRGGGVDCPSIQIRTFTTAAASQTVTCANRSYAASYNYTISPAWLATLTAGYTRGKKGAIDPFNNQLGAAIFGYTVSPSPASGGVTNVTPGVSFDIYNGLGLNSPSDQIYQMFQLNPALSWVVGKHTVRMGGDLRRYYSGGLVSAGSPNGNFGFAASQTSNGGNNGNSAASALLGLANSFTLQQTPRVRFGNNVAAVYIADDFKATSSLTINLGLRWDMEGKVSEMHNRAGYFDTTAVNPIVKMPGTFQYAGLNGAESTITAGDYNNIGPRVGFAYSPVRFHKTIVVRGGFAVTYAPIPSSGYFAVAPGYETTFSPVKASATAPAIVLTNTYSLPAAAGPLGPSAYLGQALTQPINRSVNSPAVYQWNIGFEHDFGRNLIAEVMYAGNRGTHLLANRSYDLPAQSVIQQAIDAQTAAGGRAGVAQAFLNQTVPNPVAGLVPGTLGAATRTLVSAATPYLAYSGVNGFAGERDSIYHSLQAKIEKRLSSNLTFLLSYTFSKLIDDAAEVNYNANELPNIGAVQNPYNYRDARAVGNFDRTHLLQFNSVYSLPIGPGRHWGSSGWIGRIAGGFSLTAIFSAQSGSPLAITQSDANGLGVGTARPDVIGNPAALNDVVQGLVNANGTVQWINRAGFATVNGRYGTAPIRFSQLRAPSVNQLDLGLQRDFRMGEKVTLRFRAEAFNSLNHTNFTPPEQNFSSPAFGQISSVFDPRIWQFGLQLRY